MKKKFHLNWFVLILAVLLLLCGVFFLQYFLALANPAQYNWRLDYLKPDEAVDAYLHQPDVIIALVFGILITLWFVMMLLDLLLRKKASHIALVEAGILLLLAYEIARAAYNFALGSVNILVGILYLLSLVGTLGCAVLFFKKALDGDHLGLYWLFFVLALVAFYFASGTSDSYSILNAFSHQGDFSYWFGYACSRFYFCALALCGAINLHYDYAPEQELAAKTI